jgi:hypothetical protein
VNNIAVSLFVAITGTVIALLAGPGVVGRNLNTWELALVFFGFLIAAWVIRGFQNRLIRKRELDVRDSALW